MSIFKTSLYYCNIFVIVILPYCDIFRDGEHLYEYETKQ